MALWDHSEQAALGEHKRETFISPTRRPFNIFWSLNDLSFLNIGFAFLHLFFLYMIASVGSLDG